MASGAERKTIVPPRYLAAKAAGYVNVAVTGTKRSRTAVPADIGETLAGNGGVPGLGVVVPNANAGELVKDVVPTCDLVTTEKV